MNEVANFKSRIANYLNEVLKQEASDLYLTVGFAPSIRVNNKIIAVEQSTLKREDINLIVSDLLDENKKAEFETTLELNTAIENFHSKRFRANFFYQQHNPGIVIRRIRTDIPTPESLSLPEVYKKLIMEKRGLVLMVGAAGSGKSTSMASMLGHRNNTGSGHIITVEDPIEYIHEHKGCIFTQREIGIDTYSYATALKNALRQTPDVIVIGEIRDRETMENALIFCETGHLCLATLHANNSNQAIERMVNLFPEEIHKQVLVTLSQNLKAVLSQRLVENTKSTRSLAVEVLLNVGLIKQHIEEGKIKEIKEVMEKNKDQGMQSFDQALLDLFLKGTITEETAMREADNPNNLRLKINQEKTANPLLKKTSYTPGAPTSAAATGSSRFDDALPIRKKLSDVDSDF